MLPSDAALSLHPLPSISSWKRRRIKKVRNLTFPQSTAPSHGKFKHRIPLFCEAHRRSCPEVVEYESLEAMKAREFDSAKRLGLKDSSFFLSTDRAEPGKDRCANAASKEMEWCGNVAITAFQAGNESNCNDWELFGKEEVAAKKNISCDSATLARFRVATCDLIRERRPDMDFQIEEEELEKNMTRRTSTQSSAFDRISMTHEEADSFISEPPYYSGWEDVSIEEAMEQMDGVYSAEKYIEKCICLLRKCRMSKCFTDASRIYTHICNNGLEVHGLFGSYLVSMFLECGSLPMAQVVFNKASYHNEYSWTSLIQGYIVRGDLGHSLCLFLRMLETQIQPSKYTYAAVLTICARLKCIESGFQIHARIVEEGFDDQLFVARSLVDFYAKCGLSPEAQTLFDDLAGLHDSHASTSIEGRDVDRRMVAGYFEGMPVGWLRIGAATFIYNLKACGSIGDLQSGYELNMQIMKEGFDVCSCVCNTLIDTYAKCGSIYDAFRVLWKMPNRDVVSWTALITGCVEHGLATDALKYSERMQEDNVSPNSYTYASCLKACGIIRALDTGRRLHAQIMKVGCYIDAVVCNSLIDMYVKCASVDEAQNVFDKLAIRDIIGWTSLVAGYADHGPHEKAIECFGRMRTEGVAPNAFTFVFCLKACATMQDSIMGLKLHKDLVEDGLEGYKVVGNALLSMYAKLGLYEEAGSVLHELPGRDVVSWTALICEYAEDGLGEEALNTLEQMLTGGFSPNAITYMCCLKACGSIGALKKGRMLHMDIAKRGLETNSLIGNTLVDMYAECGESFELKMTK